MALPSTRPTTERGAEVRIVEIRDAVLPMRGNIRNAYIDFTRMTASVVAVVTSVVRDVTRRPANRSRSFIKTAAATK